jgi:hypothetical protein
MPAKLASMQPINVRPMFLSTIRLAVFLAIAETLSDFSGSQHQFEVEDFLLWASYR